ncbi:MAG: S41 family peptidase [Lachnospiraceae bacterium]|nr:S41 family peptidase [Lachnospiraceae bacterium]
MEEEKQIQEEIPVKKEKKSGGFWKGFFTATVIFIIVAVISLVIGAGIRSYVWQTHSSSESETESLTTQSKDVQLKLGLLESYIRGYSLEDVDEKQLEDYLYYGLVAGLGDPYAAYYNEEETQSMLDSSSGSYCGIGAMFSQNMLTGVITVSRVYEGFPSYEAGILPEDILIRVEDEDVTGQDLTNVVTKIKGEEGTEVTITMLRGEEELEFTMKRRVIEVPTVEYEMLEASVGYILISEFDGVTDAQFHEALVDLQAQGMKSLIIDLRNNGGGSVDAVSAIADELLPEGPIVFTEYKDGERMERSSDASCVDLPMAVLMNGNSASASEILAGALQDYEAAKIVGTQSYGKGIVQSIIDLQDGTALKITTAKYYTPDGNNIHEIGITPDVEIDLPEELKTMVEIPYEEDVQLQKAIEVLQQ